MAFRFGRALALGCVVLSGCAVGPDYERPKVPMPQNWRGGAGAAGEASLANIPWWELFKDEQLRTLINVALKENRDLKIAVERIEEARARYGIAKADLYPKLGLNVTGGGLNTSDASLLHTPEGTDPTGLLAASVDLSWELDLFGRIRRASEAQKAAMLATEEARRGVAMALVSDVALAYVDLRGLDRRLSIAQQTLGSRKENVELAQTRFQGQVTNEVDFRQAEAEYHRIQGFIYSLEKLVAQKENEISFLIGRNPGDIIRNRSAEEQPLPPQVPAGLPAALLERRPDVRQAEMDLWSATANIGEAKARLYPNIKLTASYGLASTDLSKFVDPGSQTWTLFAGLLQPIFAGGALRAQVEVRESQQRQALYAYEKTLLKALREVEDSLVGLDKTGKEREEQRLRVEADAKVMDLSELRYKGGVANYLEVLDAQRSLFSAQIDEATSVSEHSRALIQLYKALGGGWPAKTGSDNANTPPASKQAPKSSG